MKKVALGIDIGGTYTKFGFVDQEGNDYGESKIDTAAHATIDDFLDSLKSAADNLLKHQSEELSLIGVGIGAPNGNYFTGTIEHAPNLRWKGVVPIIDKFKKLYHLPMALTNDANAAAIGEKMYGGAQGMQHFAVITLGTGLGSGLVTDGKLIYGYDGFAGEVGHTIVEPGGRMCGSGVRGCTEAYVSATGIKRTVFYLLADSMEKSELRNYSFNEMTAKMITQEAQKGDPIALEAFEITGKLLGRKLAELVAHIRPEAIFLFGGLAKAGDLILAPTKKYMEEFIFPVYSNKVDIRMSEIHDRNAAVLGSAALIWDTINNN